LSKKFNTEYIINDKYYQMFLRNQTFVHLQELSSTFLIISRLINEINAVEISIDVIADQKDVVVFKEIKLVTLN